MLAGGSWDGKCPAAPGDTARQVPGWGGEGSKEGARSREGMLHIPRDKAGLSPGQAQTPAHVSQTGKQGGKNLQTPTPSQLQPQ